MKPTTLEDIGRLAVALTEARVACRANAQCENRHYGSGDPGDHDEGPCWADPSIDSEDWCRWCLARGALAAKRRDASKALSRAIGLYRRRLEERQRDREEIVRWAGSL